ncbi:hypothetical protein [Kitasatospora phosalacinea]|uniref:hypothetical protein n=1 Tax=Kitasatospora phosalacinea TaxID=2065 RepID=UPI00315866CD
MDPRLPSALGSLAMELRYRGHWGRGSPSTGRTSRSPSVRTTMSPSRCACAARPPGWGPARATPPTL